MGDFAKGITAFRKGLKDDDAEESEDETQQSLRSEESAGADTRREDERAGS